MDRRPTELENIKIRTINRAGIGVQAGMIVGLDSDDKGVFQRNLEFLQKANIGALQLAILPPPARHTLERAVRKRRQNYR